MNEDYIRERRDRLDREHLERLTYHAGRGRYDIVRAYDAGPERPGWVGWVVVDKAHYSDRSPFGVCGARAYGWGELENREYWRGTDGRALALQWRRAAYQRQGARL